MFRTATNFDKLLDKATSNLRLDPDWPAILQICDLIRQNDCNPKYAVAAIKKKLYSPNPHQAMFALLVLESIVKNCGSGVHDEITTKANCEMFREIVKSSQHENVRTKTLELIQAWAFAFRNNSKYRAVQDTVNIMKAEGYKFPVLKESDAMFSADSAPEWSDGDVCHRCRVIFSLMQRKHHCRACGQVFCQQCSAKTTTLPKFGIEKEVRVCDACYDQVSRPPGPGTPAKSDTSDLPAEYVSSALAQQPQPPQKTAEELQEEEELQLALALSQSEAEQKEKERQRAPLSSQIVPPSSQQQSHSSPPGSAPPAELSRYLDRNYWEQRVQTPSSLQEPPSAPTPSPGPHPVTNTGMNDILASKIASMKLENGAATDPEMEEFITALKGQVEIFVNRMKSNSSRGRSIANDSSVQTLFMNITTMHSRLLRYIQQQDDSRVHYEGLQDKLTQVKDSRAALDVLREEHAERMRRAAEQAERQRQLQMAHKLDIMRKKKQEYLQYQRQLALQRVQEQEREMQMRQEQQKHQYMMGGSGAYYLQGSPVHQFHPSQQSYQAPPYGQGYPPMMSAMHRPPQMGPEQPGMIRQPGPQVGMPQHNMVLQQGQQMGHLPSLNMQVPPMNQQQQQMNQQGQPMGPHPGGMVPPGSMLGQQVTSMPQGPQMGLPITQHGPQGPQLSHQTSQMNQQNQMGMQGAQGSQMPISGSQQMQQGPMVGPQGAQMPQPTTQMNQQQIPQHGQMPPHSQMNQQGPQMSQQGPQMNQQGIPPHSHQMGQMPQQLGQQMGHPRPQNFPQPGQVPPQMSNQVGQPLNQNMPPGHQPQSMSHMGQNQIGGQMIGHPQPINQNQNQPPMPQSNQIPSNTTGETKLGSLSPTSTSVNSNVSSQGPPLSMVGPQTSQGSPIQQKPVIQENSTAELISFD